MNRARGGLILLAVIVTAHGIDLAYGTVQTGRPGGPPPVSSSTSAAALQRRLEAQKLSRPHDADRDPAALAAIYRQYLGDPDAFVRREIANAIAQRWIHEDYGPAVAAAAQALENQLAAGQEDDDAARMMLRGLGELPYDARSALDVERVLVLELRPAMPERRSRYLGAAEGLEALIRHQSDRQIEPATRRRLRQLAVRTPGPTGTTDPLLPALEALQAARDTDLATILSAARYYCSDETQRACGWEFRRVAAQMMDPLDDVFAEPIRTLMKDPSSHVRIEALKAVAGRIATTLDCDPLVDGFEDPVVAVAITAIDLVDKRCPNKDTIADRLKSRAIELGDPLKADQAGLPTHALEALARFAPADAKRIAQEYATTHSRALVRSAVARMAAEFNDEATALSLTEDSDPKVRTDALLSLRRLDSPHVQEAALKEIARLTPNPLKPKVKLADVGSIWTALVSLKGKTDLTMLPMLLQVLGMPETARMARLAAIDRLKELAAPGLDGISPLRESVDGLRAYLRNTDTPIEAAVADLVTTITGSRPQTTPCEEFPLPIVGATRRLVMTMMPGDQLVIELDGQEAPDLVEKFAGRATDRTDLFADTLFHRVLPNLLVQGGSEDGSDWTGSPSEFRAAAVRMLRQREPVVGRGCPGPRFWRDQFNPLRHERGAVALATNGPDTGIGQFFVDLVDVPAFNHEYTVVGRVLCAKAARAMDGLLRHPMDLVDLFQEGETIRRIEVPPSTPPLNLRQFTCVPGLVR